MSMVLFHLCYDLVFLAGIDLPLFDAPFRDIWRASIAWTFLFIAGCMCPLSRDGLRRALRYLLVAAAIYGATLWAAVDTPISFGIIFCMGASTLLEWVLSRFGVRLSGRKTALIFAIGFLLLLQLPQGYLGIGGLRLALPAELYRLPGFACIGFPSAGFASGDYYPLLPYSLMFLSGAALSRFWQEEGYPSIFYTMRNKALECVGRRALEVYIVHQPLLLLLVQLVAHA